jgi:mRNA interferase RelE/StbE
MSYRVEISKTAKKELAKIPKVYYNNIIKHLFSLSDDPNPFGSIKLEGSENTYRLRVGVYRIIYTLYNDQLLVEVVRIAHRKEAYK